MCRSVYLLVLIFSIISGSLISSSAVTQTVIPGENITLHCNITQSTEVVWFCSTTQELTVIISATKGNLDMELQVNYNKDPDHFKVLFQNVSLSLIIMDIRQSDTGLYYCGSRKEGILYFVRGVRLQFTDAVRYMSGSAQCWTPLIAVCCSFALMITLCLSVAYKRGLPSSCCRKCVKDNDLKDTDLHYATLRHNATPQARNLQPANCDVTYGRVAKNITNNLN
ncbi:uncharacterized protein LOC132857089 [Tachysurus vachellii]|uniref:uncharacterized protein LOC132857089 n=1 Tax=Tachysurus vachellii TaxID=175792 RepID=UPI00296AE7AA|nr:uncharacterized protein LOC132857089 [Tachysurus vachellii]